MTVLADLAEDLLAIAAQTLDDALVPAPDRVSTWAGQPPWEAGDCTALTVSLTVGSPTGTLAGGFPIDGSNAVFSCTISLAAELALTYIMCTPAMGPRGDAPGEDEQTAAARVFNDACQALWCASVAFAQSLEGTRDVALRGLSVQGPEGDRVAVTSRIAVEV